MREYRTCCICGCSYIGIGTACHGCEKALAESTLEIKWVTKTDARAECVRNPETRCVDCEMCADKEEVRNEAPLS